jgi:uncharacterized protein with FMN-binding domain
MRRITMWFIATVVVVVLLFSYRTSLGGGTAPGTTADGARLPNGGAGGTGTGTGNAPGIVTQPSTDPTTAPSAQPSPTGGTTSGTGGGQNTVVNGSVAQTRWGPVQVQVTITGGRIADVTALEVPNGNFRDQEINSYAVPMLRQEVLAAQSARIDTISGATVTSDGYVESLQAALDAAHFKA